MKDSVSQSLISAIERNWINLISCSKNEKLSFLKALDGQYIEPGPSGSPTRGKEEVLPTGKNFFSIDLRGLPTESAWELGRKSAQQILNLHLMQKGEHLKHLALSVWATATMRNGGEEIAQLLALLGIQPIWDGPTRRLVDLEVIPLSILQRPRVDVMLRISGLFRDAFPNLIEIVFNAQQLIGQLDESEEQNPYSKIYKERVDSDRIFGSAPGAYGAGLQELIDSGQWDTKSDLADAYLAWSKWVYKKSGNPVENIESLKNTLRNIEVVIHNQDNREHDLLDSDDYYQFHGGMAATVETLSGQKPMILFGDNSRRERPIVKALEKEIDKVMRSRVLNPIWLDSIKEHTYKGGFEMSATMDYLFGYDATTGIVPNWCYKAINKTWLSDTDIIDFLKEYNPWALRDIGER